MFDLREGSIVWFPMEMSRWDDKKWIEWCSDTYWRLVDEGTTIPSFNWKHHRWLRTQKRRMEYRGKVRRKKRR